MSNHGQLRRGPALSDMTLLVHKDSVVEQMEAITEPAWQLWLEDRAIIVFLPSGWVICSLPSLVDQDLITIILTIDAAGCPPPASLHFWFLSSEHLCHCSIVIACYQSKHGHHGVQKTKSLAYVHVQFLMKVFGGLICIDLFVLMWTLLSLLHIRATPAKLWKENND